jgi:hypothetical protein
MIDLEFSNKGLHFFSTFKDYIIVGIQQGGNDHSIKFLNLITFNQVIVSLLSYSFYFCLIAHIGISI